MKFDFSDINLVPKKCIVSSRSECDTSIVLGKHKFDMPIVPANMECVIDEDLAIKLIESKYFYIMHRFCDTLAFSKKMKSLNLLISISVGVNQDAYDILKSLQDEDIYPDYITVDIAHGHSIKMESMIKYIRSIFPESFIIAGNVSTPDAVFDLESWGADATKVGIGPGCFIPSSPVETNNGVRKISEIEVGDLVLTHRGRYRKVLNIHSYIGEHTLIKINDLPPSTETHEYYVIDKEKKNIVNDDNINEYAYWVEARYLNSSHLLIKLG